MSWSIVVSILLCLQFSSFTLLRSYFVDDTPTTTVLLHVEILKCVVSFVCSLKRLQHMFTRPCAIAVPASCFIVMNIVSYWVVADISATTYVMLLQLKIPMTCFLSYMILQSYYSHTQLFAIFLICISCVNICNKSEVKNSVLELWHVGGMLLEVILSALCSVYMQRMFDSDVSKLWLRNLELSMLSIPFYVATTFYHNASFQCSLLGYGFALLGGIGGILVGLMLTYCGAVEKTLVSAISLVVVTIVEHILYARTPKLSHLSFYTICIASVMFYSWDKLILNKNEATKPLLGEDKS